jgi:hypothetical protein
MRICAPASDPASFTSQSFSQVAEDPLQFDLPPFAASIKRRDIQLRQTLSQPAAGPQQVGALAGETSFGRQLELRQIVATTLVRDQNHLLEGVNVDQHFQSGPGGGRFEAGLLRIDEPRRSAGNDQPIVTVHLQSSLNESIALAGESAVTAMDHQCGHVGGCGQRGEADSPARAWR